MLWDHQSAVAVLAVHSTEMIINHVTMCSVSTKTPLIKLSVKQTSADSEHRVPDGATEVPVFSISSNSWFHLEIFQWAQLKVKSAFSVFKTRNLQISPINTMKPTHTCWLTCQPSARSTAAHCVPPVSHCKWAAIGPSQSACPALQLSLC